MRKNSNIRFLAKHMTSLPSTSQLDGELKYWTRAEFLTLSPLPIARCVNEVQISGGVVFLTRG